MTTNDTARWRAWDKANPERAKYRCHKADANRRGIPFLLTYEEWIGWWGDDYARRGRLIGQLVMARLNDSGPYSLDNIEKITVSQNHADYNNNIKWAS